MHNHIAATSDSLCLAAISFVGLDLGLSEILNYRTTACSTGLEKSQAGDMSSLRFRIWIAAVVQSWLVQCLMLYVVYVLSYFLYSLLRQLATSRTLTLIHLCPQTVWPSHLHWQADEGHQ